MSPNGAASTARCPKAELEACSRALLISAVVPDRNGIGIQRRAYQHVWCLSHLYHLDLIVQPRRTTSAIPQHVLDACESCLIFPPVKNRYFHVSPFTIRGMTLFRECLGFMRSWWHPYGWRTRRAVASRVQAELPRQYSAVFFFRIDTAWLDPYVRPLLAPGARRLLDLDDCDADLLRQQAAFAKSSLGLELAAAYRVRAGSLGRTERRLRRCFDITTVSNPASTRSVNGVPAAVLPNCVLPPERRMPAVKQGWDGTTNILFVGNLGYVANSDGIIDFCRNVLPMLEHDARTRISLTIIGMDPPPELQAFHHPPRITLAGWVDELEACYAIADIVIIPVRMGSGTRTKALEAMSMGRPLVSTSVGVSGLGLTPDRHYLLGDSSAEFANACLKLIRNPALGLGIAREAMAHVHETFGFEAALNRLRVLLA